MIENKPPKPKTPQAQNLTGVSERDGFQTPNYATDLLVPFMENMGFGFVWECAAGLGKIVNRLEYHGFDCVATDLSYDDSLNFLEGEIIPFFVDAIVTNPPFSIKRKFFEKCIYYSKPFALLIPADYSGWTIDAVNTWGCEKIIPTRRIDYITPNTLKRIHVGELFEFVKEKDKLKKGVALREYAEWYPAMWKAYLDEYKDYCLYDSIYDVPAKLLKKYSSSYYHSMWLTWGFNIGRSETFVELSNEDKLNI